MSTLWVFAFENETGATAMVKLVQALQRQQLITVADAATVVRRQDKKVNVKQANRLVGIGTLGGAFWGALLGRLFGERWSDQAAESGTGASVTTKVTDNGLSENFIAEIDSSIKTGHSALFMLVDYLAEDKVLTKLTRPQVKLLRNPLSAADYIKLRDAFWAAENE